MGAADSDALAGFDRGGGADEFGARAQESRIGLFRVLGTALADVTSGREFLARGLPNS